MIRTNKIALMLALCALALVAAVPAAVASPATQGYDETTVLGNVDEGGPAATESAPVADTAPDTASSPAPVAAVESTSSESSLPFTGADLGILVLMGVLLGGTGLVLRRVVRHRPTA